MSIALQRCVCIRGDAHTGKCLGLHSLVEVITENRSKHFGALSPKAVPHSIPEVSKVEIVVRCRSGDVEDALDLSVLNGHRGAYRYPVVPSWTEHRRRVGTGTIDIGERSRV